MTIFKKQSEQRADVYGRSQNIKCCSHCKELVDIDDSEID
jgi:hypothetical protein